MLFGYAMPGILGYSNDRACSSLSKCRIGYKVLRTLTSLFVLSNFLPIYVLVELGCLVSFIFVA